MKKEKSLQIALGLSAVFGLILSTSFQHSATSQTEIAVLPKVGEGLNTTIFQTPQGKINVNLPEDMAAGDELTGTVIAEPNGKTNEEKAQAEDELNGYVVEIQEAEAPAPPEKLAEKLPEPEPEPEKKPEPVKEDEPPKKKPDAPRKPEHRDPPKYEHHGGNPIQDYPDTYDNTTPSYNTPSHSQPSRSHSSPSNPKPAYSHPQSSPSHPSKPITTGYAPRSTPKKGDIPCYIPKNSKQVKVVLTKNGEKVAELPIKVPPKPVSKPEQKESEGEMEQVGRPPSGMVDIPQVGQGGRPIPIKAECDGKFGNSNVTVGGEKCKLLAEGPRSMIARSPRNIVGPCDIKFCEGNKTCTAPFCNVRVKISADKTALKPGESVNVTVTVAGLKGMKTPVKLHLQNKTPQVVDLSGGNDQTIQIDPSTL